MDDLPQFIHVFIDLSPRPLETLLTQVNCIRQERAALLNTDRVAALCELDSLGFQKSAQVPIKFCFVDPFHK